MSRLLLSVVALLLLLCPGNAWSVEGPIASGALKIQGTSLTIFADDLTTDADQTVNVGERARVRTCFGGVEAPCGTIAPGDPRISGLLVRGELHGPEIPQPIALETVPGGTFILPGFQQEGDYRLENIRLVEEATGQVLATAEPSLAVLHVREILLASATVRTLSLEELRARGITFTAENFQAFNFAVGFAFGDEIVEIELPIVYSGYGTVEPLGKPTVNLDDLPENIAHVVERWQPPHIVPFKLEQEETQALRADEEEDQTLRLPLFGAIVLPGTVSFLNQFFEAKLIVANGAPNGSGARLEEVVGKLRLPPNNVLRVAATDPAVGIGQGVPVVDAFGGRSLSPGEQGAAAWTVEGLAAGTWTLQMDITASLVRPGREPFPMLSRIQAAVEVVDARFNLSFSHPDVVREGEEYTLFVTVTNLSRAAQNLITVDLDEAHITGAHGADPGDDLRRTIQTLAPGQSETLEYRLIADLDGKVVATTFQSTSSSGQGTIRLRTGVGELGIPLSPATLVLPRFSERLKKPYLPSDDLHRANTRFLGLAYSLAVAPAALTPPGLPRVIKTDVERRAVDFAQAGMRTYLQEPLLESLEVFALDFLGNRKPLAEIDELRRGTGKGLAVGTELAKVLRAEQADRNLSAEGLFDHFAETTTYTDPYVAALLIPESGSEALELAVQGSVDGVSGTLSGAAGAAGAQRTLAYGDVLPVLKSASQPATVPLALIGHVGLTQELTVVVRNPGSQAAEGTLLVLVPSADGEEDRRFELNGVTVPAGGAVAFKVGAQIASPSLVNLATGAPAGSAPSVRRVDLPSFRLIGAVQDFRLKEEGPDYFGNMHRPNRYGNGVLYLFNRPPEKNGAEDPENYRIRSVFSGLDAAGQPASGSSEKVGTGAWVQDDGRTVAVRYATPLSALIQPGTGQPLLTHTHLLDTAGLTDAWGEHLDANPPPPTLEKQPLHVGGLVMGKVVRGTGEPVAGAKVQLIRPLLWETMVDTVVKLDFLGEVTTGADGSFFFDFIENPHWDRQVLPSFTLRATIPAGANPALEPEEVQEVSSTIRLQNRALRINIALLGRGTIRGKVVYADDGSPVATGFVRGSSTLFNEEKQVQAKPDGSFVLPGVPVGPITLTARDGAGRVVYATLGVAEPGDLIDNVILRMPRIIPGMGTVAGTVVGATSGEPIAGARVAVYSRGASLASQETDAFGRFRFDDVPEGQVSLQASNWAVSRISIFTDLLLAASETKEVELRLPQGASRTVTGSVFFHDPVTNTNVPVQGAVAFIEGPGVFAYTDAAGRYRIEGVPVQGTGESYEVKAIDFARRLEGRAALPPILDVTPDPVAAQNIVLQQMTGGVDGVVLDPLGRPLGSAEVVIYPYGTTTTQPDGSFSFNNLPIGTHSVVAHLGDGLQAGRVGYFGDAPAAIVYGGHRPFVSVRLRGAGVVTLRTKTATATGVLTPIYYKPTWYSATEYRIRLQGAYTETTTDPNGNLTLILPVGDYEIIAYNPFHGMHTLTGEIDYAGQVVHHEVVFEDAATVTGQVVGVDGVTPVPGVEVVLEANGLRGQKQRTDPQGRFRYELVPKGRVMVTAEGLAGSVERVGRTIGFVGTAGQTLELVVQLKAQGTVAGRVMENFNGVLRPLANAHYFLQEDSFPFRRIPEEGGWLVTDGQGRYQVAHVFAGGVTVVARDSGQVGRYGSARGDLTVDWQVLQMPDVVMTTSVGSLRLTVRNPVSGGPVADAQVRLSNQEATVTDAEGVAFFDALPLGSYDVYAFYAPTGQSGRLAGVQLSSPGQQIARTIYLDQRGDVRGTLWGDAAKTIRVEGGVVRLDGVTAGGRVSALATTSSEEGSEGRFEFQGIPEGTFLLEAAHPTTPQRASATAAITATSPVVDVNMILEAIGDRWFRLFEKLRAGTTPVNLSSGVFSTRLTQDRVYDFAQLTPEPGTDRFRFRNVLLTRPGAFGAEELTGERRKTGASFPNFTAAGPVAGTGTENDPYQLVLGPKGVVRVTVRDGAGQAVPGANVTLNTSGGGFPSLTGADGTVTFAAVPAGGLNATASSIGTGTSGYSTGTLTWDDELVEMTVALAPAVAAHGLVYLPVPDDRWNGDPAQLVPAPGILVEIRDSKGKRQLVQTDAQGTYRFGGLPTGGYQLTARNSNGDQQAAVSGTLAGPDGNDNAIPSLILDAGPPRLLSIAPPPGFEGVSLRAAVELVFSEPLLQGVLPNNSGNPHPYFSLRSAGGAWAAGAWSASLNAAGQQVVRFVPSADYLDNTVYSLTVAGGSGGVRDRAGRPLTTSGNVGSNFKTSDVSGPAVIGTNPSLDRPVDPAVPIRFDFSEAVYATDEQLDGDLDGDAAELQWQHDPDGPGSAAPELRRLPVTTYLTRSNFSLVVQAAQGISLEGDTLRRQVRLVGLKDAQGNVMPPYTKSFRIYDAHPPQIDAVPYPPGAPIGELLQGERYTIAPSLSSLDDVTASLPGGDVDRVDYFFADPTDPAHPVQPAYSARTFPYSYSFIGAYSGDGTAPRPFPVWVQAVDTSTNKSNVVLVSMVVLPNTDPRIESVGLTATAPVPGVTYAGSTLLATVDGLYDLDGAQLTLFAELWKEGDASPMAATSGRLVQRPATGWNDAPSQTFTFTLPIDVPEGTQLWARARVIDPNGATGATESERSPVTDDDAAPAVDDFSARLAGAPVTHLFIGEELYLEVKARDRETGIQTITLELDRTDLFPGTLTATKVTGTQDLYRTGMLTVPAGITGPVPITASLRIDDWGGNVAERTAAFQISPERDPYAPTARWQLPWQGALWPAGHTSTVASAQGAALLLRFHARDTNADADGNPVPGRLVTIQLRGPVRNAETGAIEIASAWTAAQKVPGTEDLAGAVYQGIWRLPNDIPAGTEVPFEARLIDSAGTETVTRVTMTAVAARRVYEGAVTSVPVDDAMLGEGESPDGPVFLLDGTTLSVLPQDEGSDGVRPVRHLPGLFLYAGASTDTGALAVRPTVLTAPEITTYDSSDLYHPLELAVDNELGISVESRVDMTRKGLLGSTSTRSMVLPGETGAEARAGGSHGGAGWSGSPSGGWDRTNLARPGSVFDSLRDPRLPGGGGGSADNNAGGAGGGVIRLLAEGARVRLDGEIVANGGNGTGEQSGGGAGGAVRLTAHRIEGLGRILAQGGGGAFHNTTGGGGGGRIALSYREIAPSFDPAARLDAAGGINDAPVPARAVRRGGAGTVFVEAVDPETGVAAPGRLFVENPLEPLRAGQTPLPAVGDGAVASIDPALGLVVLGVPRVRGEVVGDHLALAAADGSPLGSFRILEQARETEASAPGGFRVHLTVAAAPEELAPAAAALASGTVSFHGVSRLATVEAEASVRLLADDDLLLGPEAAPALNDRGALLLKRGARALLRGEGPVVTFTTQPAIGADLLLGTAATLSWKVSDPLGLVETKTESTFAPTPDVKPLWEEQLTAQSASTTTLPVPINSALTGVSYTVEARNTAGRVTRQVASWPVPANALPTGTVAVAAGTITPLRAGYSFQAVVTAADRERLARITLQASGPVDAASLSQSETVSGTSATKTFTVKVLATADGSQPVVLQALLEDASGGAAPAPALNVPVAANGAPGGTVALAAGAPAQLERGKTTTVVVQAEDADGLTRIDLHAAGPVTQPEQTRNVSGTSASATFTLTATADAAPGSTVSVTATLRDALGKTGTTAPFAIPVVANGVPTGSVELEEGAWDVILPGQSTSFVVRAADPDGLVRIELHATGAVTQPVQTQTVSGTSAEATFTLTATADAPSQIVTVTAVLVDQAGSTATTAPVTFEIYNPADRPVLEVYVNSPEPYRSGDTLQVSAFVREDVVVTELRLEYEGTVLDTIASNYVWALWEVPVLDAPADFTFLAVAIDDAGNEYRATRTITAQPRVVALTFDPESYSYRSGDTVTLSASAHPAFNVTGLRLEVDGTTVASSTGGPVTYTWTVPEVTGWTEIPVEAVGLDAQGTEWRDARLAYAEPVPVNPPPVVAFTCPTAGAVLPTDYVATLSARASDDSGIDSISFYVGDSTAPFYVADFVGNPPTASTTFDLSTVSGPVVRFRVVAQDFLGATGEQVIEVFRVPVTYLKTDAQGGNDWASPPAGILAMKNSGNYTVDELPGGQPVSVDGLLVLNGAKVVHGSGNGVRLNVAGPFYVACGGSINVSTLGYNAGTTYPDHRSSGGGGGSHMGEGSGNGETYGSVYFPLEAGAGGTGSTSARGGGRVAIDAGRAQVDGEIRADGTFFGAGSAGGSVSIAAQVLAGSGLLTANGGNSGGAGGAISLRYEELEAGSTLLTRLQAFGGASSSTSGGPGTVYLRHGEESFGDLFITRPGFRRTVLPSLGQGTALAGSDGLTLVTGRTPAIPPYFVGHWVEVRDAATGALKGTGRVRSISNGTTLELEAGAGETLDVQAGDLWQGVYRFGRMTVSEGHQVVSADPIRLLVEQVITGTVEAEKIQTGRLVLKSGAVLTHPATGAGAAKGLTIDVEELVIEPGAVIDVTGRGYGSEKTTYPAHVAPNNENGGSHLGEGGVYQPNAGETFGSVYFPRENGGGARESAAGGGVVRIVADRVRVDGTILANGVSSDWVGGAGGSVWIETSELSGSGRVEARGAATLASSSSGRGGGGGGIAIDYQTLEAGSTLLGNLSAMGGPAATTGGAGTVYVRGGTAATFGRLAVDNGANTGMARTIFPALGGGVAQPGSGGVVLATGRAKAIPPYFVGHWVEVRNGAGTLKGTWRIAAIGADGTTVTLEPGGGTAPAVAEGDRWQGVYRFDEAAVRGEVRLVSADPIRVTGEQVLTGKIETDALRAGKLVIRQGTELKHAVTASAASPQSLSLEAGELVLEAGATIDVSGLGYRSHTMTYPGHVTPNSENGGSHLGEGGVHETRTAGETFGSVYFPRENGGGAREGAAGGGTVRIVAGQARIDGTIRANGKPSDWVGGAGGSVWIEASELSGSGLVEARGATTLASASSGRAGGGGAIAIGYQTLAAGSTLLDHLSAQGGPAATNGGAGTVYVRGGSAAAHGHLTVDNGALTGQKRTVLPSLGQGTAGSGSSGATLITGRSLAIPAYFVGHWVEVRSAATGELEGAWRISSIGVDGRSVVLASNAGEPVTVNEGDAWQGVYRLDAYTVRGEVQVISLDPIRVASEQVITGTVETGSISAGRLVIKPGATLTQRLTGAATESLVIQVQELVVEAGGAIDVSARGYGGGTSYPNHVATGSGWNGGSHLGEGGTYRTDHATGETFGSVTRPQENGGAGGYGDLRGGGAVRVIAQQVVIDGAIRANGQNGCEGAAGGSVWVQTSSLAGSGVIEAKGGDVNFPACESSGGGGAIAVEYASLASGSTLLDNLRAQGGTTGATGGAGTVWVRGGAAPAHGRLTVDSGAVTGHRRTGLPSLGRGTAGEESGGATLATGRSKTIPAYFVGHWVEVRSGATGTLEGTWRIASIAADGRTVALASNAGEPVTVDPGDAWQGIYRFDAYTVRGDVQVDSLDPIRVSAEQVVAGTVETDAVYADRLVVGTGATLTQRLTGSPSAPGSLTVQVRELVVEEGGAIDVSARGYAGGTSYPGHMATGSGWNGGSHLGQGGVYRTDHATGETFGSVYRPRESGGGGGYGPLRGGGALRVTAERVQIDGALRANGQNGCEGAGGGSVWVQTGVLAGAGTIEAKGGDVNAPACESSGGGGAIAVEYASVEPASILLDSLRAQGGATGVTGGAGTVYLRGPGANLGSLVVDNVTVTGSRRTILPALGRGIVQPGSSGGTVLTGRDTNVPAYFAGSWVEVEGPDRIVKGIWRIASIDGTAITLEPKATQPFTIAPGDRWRGVYRFDQVTVSGTSVLVSADPVVQIVPPLPNGARRLQAAVAGSYESLYGNDEAPAWERALVAVAVGTVPGSYRVTLASGAVADPDGISEVRLTSGGRSLTAAWSAAGAVFYWTGRPGQQLHLVATDAHGRFQRSGWLELPALPDGGWEAQLVLADGVTPLALTGGADWLALADAGVWLYGLAPEPTDAIPPRSADEEVLALAASDRFLFVGTRERLDLLDREARSVVEVPVTAGSLLDVAVDGATAEGEATVLLTDLSDPAQPALRLSQVLMPDGQAPVLSVPSDPALPLLRAPRLHRTDGYLHLLGLAPGSGELGNGGVIYTWPSSAPGEPLLTVPTTFTVPAGWRATGPWERGAVLVQGSSVALFEHGAGGWAEVSRLALEAEPLSAAVTGDSLVVLLPGEIQVWNVASADAPALLARHPGSSFREVEPLPGGEVVLWSPRMAAPPLRWNPATALPGQGFTTVLDGLP